MNIKKPVLIRITSAPQSLWKLLEGQLKFMSQHFEVIAVSSPGDKLEIVRKREGVRVCSVEMTRKITPFKDLAAIYRLVRIFKKEQPLIVHTHTPKAGLVGMIAAKIAGVKNRLHTVAGLPVEVEQGLKRRILIAVEKLTYTCSTHVYPNSNGMKRFILENKLCPPSKVSIIGNGSSNGIDVEHFNPTTELEEQANSIREELDIANQFVFGFVGRLVKDKGIEELLYAFNEINKEYSNTALLLLGKYEDHLDPISVRNRIILENHPNIHFVGYQADVRPYFLAMNCFVFPSYREGLPNVLLQSCALAVPTIATAINGNTDIIDDNENGLLVSAQNEEELLVKMKHIYQSTTQQESLKERAREKIIQKYSRQEVWQALLTEYNMITTNK